MGFGQVTGRPADPVVAAARAGVGMGPPEPAETPGPGRVARRLGELPLCAAGRALAYHVPPRCSACWSRGAGQPFVQFLAERIFDRSG